ncbi:YIP1 family protein [Roseicyclus amphidinii]|jgi:small-conductance mechanosensitive channel|uniref:YIP1 family protein n=1 Tax=Roseicyclus amphidinii TaxID=3034232 RepID=UPI0024E0F8C3|nr:hypothetical protein [Roseicyclus sp. Amp-Y-6]
MPVSTDIVGSWRRPGRVMRRLLDMGRREDRALMFLMLGCGLMFVGQWPLIAREEALMPDQGAPLQARLAITFFAWLMVWPIALYALGGLTHLVARLFGGRGSHYTARLALFWALLAASPAWLFYGMVAGFIGPGPAANGAGILWAVAFLTIWIICLREAEREPEAQTAT